MLASSGSATSGHNSSTATAPAENRTNAPTATPRIAANAAYNAKLPATCQVAGLVGERSTAISGSVNNRATSTAPSTMTIAATEENAAHTMAFAASTTDRFGVAMNVVRINPVRYSPVMVIDASTMSTGTPNTATPSAALPGGNGV